MATTINRKLTQLALAYPFMVSRPATADEITDVEAKLGVPLHADYSNFLTHCGGAMLGAFPLFGVHPVEVMGGALNTVLDVTTFFRNQHWPHLGLNIVVSEDQAGNAIWMNDQGRLVRYDHDFGDVTVVADSLDHFIDLHVLDEL